jgi:hypothetical protein
MVCKLGFSLYAFKGRIANSNTILKPKSASVILEAMDTVLLINLLRGHSYSEINAATGNNQPFFSSVFAISASNVARECL